MRHGSLFSGIGGFDLAAEWAGWDNVFHCEYEPFAQKILKHHFPNSKLYNDIRTFDATDYFGRIDILTGGFPCQPFSSAGKRKGTEDDRHLWKEMLRIIREVAPKYVVGENVRGLINWSGGLVFEEVCADLEAEGYEVQPYLLPACAKNAPHRRDRIWFIAYSCSCAERQDRRTSSGETQEIWGNDERIVPNGSTCARDAPDSVKVRLQYTKKNRNFQESTETPQSEGSDVTESSETNGFGRVITHTYGSRTRQDNGQGESRQPNEKSQVNDWANFPTQSPLCGGDDGLPKELDGITFSKWRKESIKAYGNAIVPQVAYEIFKAINELESINDVS